VDLGGHVMVLIWGADSHVLIDVQRVGLLSEIVRPDESTCFGGVVVFGAVSKVPPPINGHIRNESISAYSLQYLFVRRCFVE
jgi:hypothetical protein